MADQFTPESNILITGATGLIGGEVLRRLADRRHRGTVWALVRPTEDQDPDERLRARLRRSGGDGFLGGDVRPVSGDIRSANWGLPEAERGEIACGADVIIHNAADTSFAAHRDTASTNVEGIRRLIAFARTCHRRPLIVYMSTASNAGRVAPGCLTEDHGCRPDNEHFNEYTHSKAVGEQLLRDSGLPVLTLRPTIVLRAGLPDPVFARQILWCAPLTRAFPALPVDPDARLDLVDVGFVAEATLRLMEATDRAFDCYHLSAGRAGCVTVGELGEIVAETYGRRTPIQLIPPDRWTRAAHREHVNTPLRRKVFRSLRHYLPFLSMDVVYDDARLRSAIPTEVLSVRPPRTYFKHLLKIIRHKAALQEAVLP